MKAPVIESRFHDPNPIATLNRETLRKAGIVTVSIVGGPGCGKTTLIDATLERLMPDVHVGVIACDVASHRDADRMSRHSDQVVQVNTGEGHGLRPSHVRDALRWLDLEWLDLLLIENVGTLIGPANLDLGQDDTAVLFSVAAGDDKADKHPDLVRGAKLVILNKTDLLPSVPFNLTGFRSDVKRINPAAELIELSALQSTGLDHWLAWLKHRVSDGQPQPSQWFG